MMQELTGQTGEKLENIYEEMNVWTGGSWSHADTDTLDEYIEQDHVCKGPLYRGLAFSEADYQAFMDGLEPGSRIDVMGSNSSLIQKKKPIRVIPDRMSETESTLWPAETYCFIWRLNPQPCHFKGQGAAVPDAGKGSPLQ